MKKEEINYRTAVPEKFRELYGMEPTVVVRAPGRINLIGEHTDYNNGFVFPAAINKEIVFAMGPSKGADSAVFALNVKQGTVVDHATLLPNAKPAWINFFSGVVAGLQRRGLKIPPVSCVFGGDIPNGAGLSSSAALEVGFGTALNELCNLGVEPWDIVKIAQKAEHEFVGVKCGIMDMFASKMGKKGHAMLLDCQSLLFDYFPVSLGDYQLLLIDTQVKHSLASSEYNTRRQECEKGVEILRKHKAEAKSLRDFTPGEIEEHSHELPDKVYRRCRFVAKEIERTQEAAVDLNKGDILAFGAKMFETHQGLSRDYEVSCPELDFLAEQAQLFPDKIPGARMMGGGFGGCTINIVKTSFVEEFKKHVDLAYTRKFHISPVFIDVSIEDGAGLLGA